MGARGEQETIQKAFDYVTQRFGPVSVPEGYPALLDRLAQMNGSLKAMLASPDEATRREALEAAVAVFTVGEELGAPGIWSFYREHCHDGVVVVLADAQDKLADCSANMLELKWMAMEMVDRAAYALQGEPKRNQKEFLQAYMEAFRRPISVALGMGWKDEWKKDQILQLIRLKRWSIFICNYFLFYGNINWRESSLLHYFDELRDFILDALCLREDAFPEHIVEVLKIQHPALLVAANFGWIAGNMGEEWRERFLRHYRDELHEHVLEALSLDAGKFRGYVADVLNLKRVALGVARNFGWIANGSGSVWRDAFLTHYRGELRENVLDGLRLDADGLREHLGAVLELKRMALDVAGNFGWCANDSGEAWRDAFLSHYREDLYEHVLEALRLDVDGLREHSGDVMELKRAALDVARNFGYGSNKAGVVWRGAFLAHYRDELHEHVLEALRMDVDGLREHLGTVLELKRVALCLALNASACAEAAGAWRQWLSLHAELMTEVRAFGHRTAEALRLFARVASVSHRAGWTREAFAASVDLARLAGAPGEAALAEDRDMKVALARHSSWLRERAGAVERRGEAARAVLDAVGWHLRREADDCFDDEARAVIGAAGLLALLEERSGSLAASVESLEKLAQAHQRALNEAWELYLRIRPGKGRRGPWRAPKGMPGFGEVWWRPWLWPDWLRLRRIREGALRPSGWQVGVEKAEIAQRDWLVGTWCAEAGLARQGVHSPERLLFALWLCDAWMDCRNGEQQQKDGEPFPGFEDWLNSLSKPWITDQGGGFEGLRSLMTDGEGGDMSGEPLDGARGYVRTHCDRVAVSCLYWLSDVNAANELELALCAEDNAVWHECSDAIRAALEKGEPEALNEKLDAGWREAMAAVGRMDGLLEKLGDLGVDVWAWRKCGERRGELLAKVILGVPGEVLEEIAGGKDGGGDILSGGEGPPEQERNFWDALQALDRRLGRMMRLIPGWMPADAGQRTRWGEPLSLRDWSRLLLGDAGFHRVEETEPEPEAVWKRLERQRALLAAFDGGGEGVMEMSDEDYRRLIASLDPTRLLTAEKTGPEGGEGGGEGGDEAPAEGPGRWPALEILLAHAKRKFPPVRPGDAAGKLEPGDALIQLYWRKGDGVLRLAALVLLHDGALSIEPSGIEHGAWLKEDPAAPDAVLREKLRDIADWLNRLGGDGVARRRVVLPPELEPMPLEAWGAEIVREVGARALRADGGEEGGGSGALAARLAEDLDKDKGELGHVVEKLGGCGLEPEVIDGEAGAARMLELFGRKRWIHLITHGEYSADSPLDSFLQLGEWQRLPVWLLAGRRIAADVVVLSACDSARRDAGDEAERQKAELHALRAAGIGALLRAAGARCVVGSLDKVDDQVAAAWMRRFYDELGADKSVGEAARATRAWMMGLDSKAAKRAGIDEQVAGDFDDEAKRRFHAGAFVILGDDRVRLKQGG